MNKKEQFIQALAKYLAENQAGKSVAIQVEQMAPAPKHLNYPKWGEEWAHLRTASGLRGYVTVEEAVQHLTEMLK